ncbi:hypothetical protein [Maliponia aquimaris]|uniref:Uncharacterized protein n=1 Tax=Maliponia aquimaris TaxID=1673631 RepID=A0A238L741_9RHOB|nr:hypothetical protein [Maliponia aquimaris]SMX50819.1 hypothetical protein MAA8898_05019 [Maliponia aquimaris]
MKRFLTCLSVCFGFCAGTAALAEDWNAEIAAVEKQADAYVEYGLKKSGTSSVQQAVGMIGIFADVERHRCAILGRMLGRADAVRELIRTDLPPITESLDGYEAVEIGASLGNWVGEAKWAVSATEADRIGKWNLDCVGTMVAATAYIDNPTPEAEFAAEGSGMTVYGDIDLGFFERFSAFLAQHPDVTLIALGSGGGSVKDAMQTGREIRVRGIETVLTGNCYSACPLVFAGGVERTVWADVRNDFGFHRLSTRDGLPLPDDHPFYGLIAEYLTEMGVDAEMLIGWMLKAGPQGLFSPEPQVLCDPNLATFVQRICAKGKRF